MAVKHSLIDRRTLLVLALAAVFAVVLIYVLAKGKPDKAARVEPAKEERLEWENTNWRVQWNRTEAQRLRAQAQLHEIEARQLDEEARKQMAAMQEKAGKDYEPALDQQTGHLYFKKKEARGK